jgi:hypothetical protein
MPQRLLRWALPSLFLLCAIWVSVLGLYGTAPVACDELPQVFRHGMKTRQSTTLEVVASHCEVTDRSTHETVENTEVNWPGLVASVAGCVAAWLLGASITRLVDRRRGLAATAVLALVATGGLLVLFS